MHAGDAIWYLYAGLRIIERRHTDEPATLKLVDHLRSSVRTVGDHCGVPEPSEEDYAKLSRALENLDCVAPPIQDDLALDDVEYATDRPAPPAPPRRGGGGKYGDPELVDAGRTLVGEMVDSGQFDWADMINSIQAQLESDSPFITPKQFRALINIAERGKGGDDMTFWEYFEDEYQEAAKVAAEQARQA